MSLLHTRTQSPSFRLSIILFVLFIAFALRIYTLNDLNYHWDEGYTDWMLELSIADMLDTTARDVHPPLSYMLISGFQQLGGDSAFVLRYIPLLAGFLTVAVVFMLGRAVGGFWTGLIAMVLLTISRAHIDISQFARMHSLAVLFSTLALWMTLKIWLNPKDKLSQFIYIIAVTAGLLTFYLTAIIPITTTLVFFIAWWRSARNRADLMWWIGSHLVIGVLCLPWAYYVLQRLDGWASGEVPSFSFFFQFYFVTLTTGVSINWEERLVYVIASLGVTVVGAGIIIYRVRKQSHKINQLLLLIVAVMMPVIVVFILTQPFHDLGRRPLATRYLLMTIGAFYTLTAWGIVSIGTLRRQAWMIGIMPMVIVVGVSLTGLDGFYDGRVVRDDFISVGNTLNAHRQAGDAVILHNDERWTIFGAHYDDTWVNVPFRQPVDEGYANFLLDSIWDESDALWLVSTPESARNDPNRAIEAWLSERAMDTVEWVFNEVTVTLFSRTQERANYAYSVVDESDFNIPISNAESNLISADIPLSVYPVGDVVSLATYWREAPDNPILLILESEGDRRDIMFEPPQSDSTDIVRYVINIPITPDFQTQTYTIYLNNTIQTYMENFSVIDLSETVTADNEDIPNRVDLQLGDSINLLGYDINQSTFEAGDTVDITLYWRTDVVIEDRYKVSVFALGGFNPDTGNPLWGQQDSEPLNWQLPTTQWQPNTIIADTYRFELPETTPAGEYTIGVVMYGLNDGVRLNVMDEYGTALGDTVTLLTISVE